MRKILIALSIVSAFCVLTETASAQNCLCAKIPMFQTSGGWLHYSTVHNQPMCVFQYATSLIASGPLPVQECGSMCGTCQSQGGNGLIPGTMDFHFNQTLVSADDIDDSTSFKAYLRKISDDLPITEYDKWDFVEFKVLKLTRRIGSTDQPFFALVCKMRHRTVSTYYAHIGVEVSGAGSSATVNPTHQCRALNSVMAPMVAPTPLTGVLRVAFGSNDIALIRLHQTTNAGVTYGGCDSSTMPKGRELPNVPRFSPFSAPAFAHDNKALQLDGHGPSVNSQPNPCFAYQTCQTVCYVQCCKQRKSRCRKCRC